MLKKSLLLAYLLLAFLYLLASVSFASGIKTHFKSLDVSPDGKTIAITVDSPHSSFIFKVNAETGEATRLTNAKSGFESSPSFSPDGKQIAYTFALEKSPKVRIFVVNSDGTQLHQWSSSEENDFRPLFSPDGKTLIFGRSSFYGSYSPIAQPALHEWHLYASDLDGKNVRQLTAETYYAVSPAAVSPEGKELLFVDIGEEKIEIHSIADPEATKKLFFPHLKKIALGPILNYPNYLPDGKSILFMAASERKIRSAYDYDVYQADLDTGAVKRLTTGNGYASDLKVSANGKVAAFLKWRSDWLGTPVKNEVFVLNLQTNKASPLKVIGIE